MSGESFSWFTAQAAAIGLSALAGLAISRCRPAVWKTLASVATLLMLGWPAMRYFPAVFIGWLTAGVMIFIEVTGIVIPAAFLFAVASRKASQPGERRAIALLLVVCFLYFGRNGSWMIRPAVPDLGETQISRGICRQSTDYTCVAASMVTMLGAWGIETTETQAARLSYTAVNGGTTDTRAVAAIEKLLAGVPINVCYDRMSYPRLQEIPKPCLASIKWSYFASHMVPILDADDKIVVTGDPLKGRQELPLAEFLDVWHGTCIYLVDRRASETRQR